MSNETPRWEGFSAPIIEQFLNIFNGQPVSPASRAMQFIADTSGPVGSEVSYSQILRTEANQQDNEYDLDLSEEEDTAMPTAALIDAFKYFKQVQTLGSSLRKGHTQKLATYANTMTAIAYSGNPALSDLRAYCDQVVRHANELKESIPALMTSSDRDNLIRNLRTAELVLPGFNARVVNRGTPTQCIAVKWQTPDINCKFQKYDVSAPLGRYNLLFHFGYKGGDILKAGNVCRHVRVSPVDEFCMDHQSLNSDYPSVHHPHVNGSGLCWGDGLALGGTAADRLDFVSLNDVVVSILNTYNEESPYFHFEVFAKGACSVCGEEDVKCGALATEKGKMICTGCGKRYERGSFYNPKAHALRGGILTPHTELRPGLYVTANGEVYQTQHTLENRDDLLAGFVDNEQAYRFIRDSKIRSKQQLDEYFDFVREDYRIPSNITDMLRAALERIRQEADESASEEPVTEEAVTF